MTQQRFIEAVAEEFELAFISTGLRPARRNWGDGVNDGCMVTALDVGENGAAAAKSLLSDIKLPARRIARVVKHLSGKFPQFSRAWWKTFVNYGILAFDGFATYPQRWLQTNGARAVSSRTSAKLCGAAVGGLVACHVCAPPKCERSSFGATSTCESSELTVAAA